jgi:hypothetical protein
MEIDNGDGKFVLAGAGAASSVLAGSAVVVSAAAASSGFFVFLSFFNRPLSLALRDSIAPGAVVFIHLVSNFSPIVKWASRIDRSWRERGMGQSARTIQQSWSGSNTQPGNPQQGQFDAGRCGESMTYERQAFCRKLQLRDRRYECKAISLTNSGPVCGLMQRTFAWRNRRCEVEFWC